MIACFSYYINKQLYAWNAYLSLLGYNLVIAGLYNYISLVFSFDSPMHWNRNIGEYQLVVTGADDGKQEKLGS